MSDEWLKVRIDRTLKEQLRTYAHSQNSSMTEVAATAIEEYLNPEDYKTVSLSYLSQVERRNRLLSKRMDDLIETVGKFVLFYLLHTEEQPSDPEQLKARRISAAKRYNTFVKQVARATGESAYTTVLEKMKTSVEDFVDGGGE